MFMNEEDSLFVSKFVDARTKLFEDIDNPIIEPPNTQPQTEIPILSIETKDWA